MESPVKTILIVGGVAGGASAATRARRMNEDANIIILEKGQHVSFANCGLPYYIGGEISNRSDLLLASPEKFNNWFNIEVRTGHEAQGIDRENNILRVRDRDSNTDYEQSYDRLILSPGGSPILPSVDGINANNLFTLRNLSDTDRIKSFIDAHDVESALVVGAGFIGLEMTEMLHGRGLSVSLVEMLEQVLPPLDEEMTQPVEAELEEQGVELHLGNGFEDLKTDGNRVNRVRLEDGQILETDMVMMCMGIRPNTKLAEEAGLTLGPEGGIHVNAYMQTSDPDIYAVGDAVEYEHDILNFHTRIPLAGPANRAGRIAGEHAATGHAPAMAPVLGTAIVKVFDQTAAITGINEKQAREQNRPHESVWVPGKNHAGYYPGARRINLKVIYSPETGEILGGQAVGKEGVDKRIDVLASSMHFGGTIEDLTELDLAYAPPYGSAKDVVHMAGFTAHNALRDLADFVKPTYLKEKENGTQVLDVRSESEYEQDHLDPSENIPLGSIRDRLEDLDRDREVLVVCGIGKRAYYAARILRERGFDDVKILGAGLELQT